ncbi:MAG: T9SS type A sorting domain-containing protein [Bacteroidetes bacterium]|nr:T9SS type A sorting domain-containing protein [Bacteroidota bacterium]
MKLKATGLFLSFFLFSIPVTGQTGNALSLDGSQTISIVPGFETITDQTMEFWFKKHPGQETEIISYLGNTGSRGWGLIAWGNQLVFLSGGITFRETGYQFPSEQWIHLAATVTKLETEDYTALLYVNGERIDSFQVGINPIIPGDSLSIGHGAANEYVTGDFDEYRFWESARTPQEIRENLYSSITSANPYLVWVFDETNGAESIPDVTLNGHNGSISGTPAFIPSDYLTLPYPVLNAAVPDDGSILVKWTAPADTRISKYYIYGTFSGTDAYEGEGEPTYPAGVSGIDFVDSVESGSAVSKVISGLTNGDHFNLTVQASTPYGLKSLPSNSLTGAARPRINNGYNWKYTDDSDGPSYAWTDISEVGTPILFTAPVDDEFFGKFPIGFKFPFYSADFDSFYISSNGLLTFDHGSTEYINQALPSATASDSSVIATYWNDMEWTETTTAYYFNDGNRLIIQISQTHNLGEGGGGGANTVLEPGYKNSQKFTQLKSTAGNPVLTYQVILYPNGNVEWQFNEVSLTQGNATIGFQNNDKSQGLTLFHNQNLIRSAMSILLSAPVIAPPVLEKAIPNDTEVTLSWLYENPEHVSKFLIYALPVPVETGERALQSEQPAPIDSVIGNSVTTKTITGLQNHDRYDFAVVAVVRGTRYSDYSNTLRCAARPRTDLAGYSWKFSDDPDGEILPWVDISETGTRIWGNEGSADDEAFGKFPIGFNFPFYSGSFDSLFVTTNGQLSFGNYSTDYSNTLLPKSALGYNAIMMYWNDMVWESYTQVHYLSGTDKFILQVDNQIRYQDWESIGGSTARGTAKPAPQTRLAKSTKTGPPSVSYQLVLYPDGSFNWIFGPVTMGQNDATLGFQNAAGDQGITIFYDQNLVKSGMTIQVTNPGITVPVELTSFTAVPSGNSVLLKWQTRSETNNAGFEVQKSIPSKNTGWVSAGFIPGSVTTTEAREYSFTDSGCLTGTLYRLKQIDTDGKTTLSRILEVNPVPDKFEVSANYPNPFNPSTKIRITLPSEQKVLIRIFNILGQEVSVPVNQKLVAGVSEITLNGSELASGIYFYSVTANGKTMTRSMTLMK